MPTTTKPNKRKRGRHDSRNKERGRAATRDWPGDKARPARIATTKQEPSASTVPANGVLEMHPKGYGFLRDAAADYRPSEDDVFVSNRLIEEHGLRPGSMIRGLARQVRNRGGPPLVEVQDIDDCSSGAWSGVKEFAALTPINPESWLPLETGPESHTTRVIDMLVPVGKGQRGLIVAPPRTGKTVLLQHIGHAVGANHTDVKLIVLLVDERPEEVTDMRRSMPGEVLASSLDQPVESHVRLSRLVVDRCQRLVEQGHDVLLLVDSLTRMSRAFNKWVGDTGRTMTGGLDIKALDIPKKLFATARAFEEGGSLTILGTALIETGSRMDDLIFEEFKGTGNLELLLDRQLADRRIWPAIDISRSGTRREELLLDAETLHAVTALRRTLNSMHPTEAMERLKAQLAKCESNREFIEKIIRQADRAA